MSTGIMEKQLLRGLNADSGFAATGCTAQIAPSGGVTLSRMGHVRAIWSWQSGAFVLTVPGSRKPRIEVETVAEAVRYSRETLCRDL